MRKAASAAVGATLRPPFWRARWYNRGVRGRVALGVKVAHTHTTLWEGPSAFDGAHVRAVVKAHENDKVGSCIGLWITPAAERSIDAVKHGRDRCVCGDCVHRTAKTCYTHASTRILWNVPDGLGGSLWQTLARTPRGATHLRSAVHGDIGALPAAGVDAVRAVRAQYGLRPLGYTHAWRDRADLRADHMASVDSVDEAAAARGAGWRYFRTRMPGEPLLAGEVQCPATAEARRLNPITCSACGLCDGHVQAVAHGLKLGAGWAIAEAAHTLGARVAPGDALVPVPGRGGCATHTLALADALAALTGAHVADVLRGAPRPSQYERKRAGLAPLAGDDFGLWLTHAPTGPRLWLLDNVADTGETIAACRATIGGGEPLLWATTARYRSTQ